MTGAILIGAVVASLAVIGAGAGVLPVLLKSIGTVPIKLFGAYQTPNSYPVAYTATAISMFCSKWSERFPSQALAVRQAMEGLKIEWRNGDTFSWPLIQGRLRGLTPKKGHIVVADRGFLQAMKAKTPPERDAAIASAIRKTALPHELTHHVLWCIYGDGDADHAGSGGHWTSQHDAIIEEMRVME